MDACGVVGSPILSIDALFYHRFNFRQAERSTSLLLDAYRHVQTYLGVIVEVGFLFGVFPGYHA